MFQLVSYNVEYIFFYILQHFIPWAFNPTKWFCFITFIKNGNHPKPFKMYEKREAYGVWILSSNVCYDAQKRKTMELSISVWIWKASIILYSNCTDIALYFNEYKVAVKTRNLKMWFQKVFPRCVHLLRTECINWISKRSQPHIGLFSSYMVFFRCFFFVCFYSSFHTILACRKSTFTFVFGTVAQISCVFQNIFFIFFFLFFVIKITLENFQINAWHRPETWFFIRVKGITYYSWYEYAFFLRCCCSCISDFAYNFWMSVPNWYY